MTSKESCPECGGAGQRIYGDGGTEDGRRTEYGWSEECDACNGTGLAEEVAFLREPSADAYEVPVSVLVEGRTFRVVL